MKRIGALIVIVTMLILSGCTKANKIDTPIQSDDTKGEVKLVNVHEITENNLIKGLDKDLSEGEIKDLVNILKDIRVDTEENDNINIKYDVSLYDEKESLIVTLYKDVNGTWWLEDKKIVKSDGLDKWLEGIKNK